MVSAMEDFLSTLLTHQISSLHTIGEDESSTSGTTTTTTTTRQCASSTIKIVVDRARIPSMSLSNATAAAATNSSSQTRRSRSLDSSFSIFSTRTRISSPSSPSSQHCNSRWEACYDSRNDNDSPNSSTNNTRKQQEEQQQSRHGSPTLPPSNTNRQYVVMSNARPMNGHRTASAKASGNCTHLLMHLATKPTAVKKINKFDDNDCYQLPLYCVHEEEDQQPHEEQQPSHGERLIELIQKLSIRAALAMTSSSSSPPSSPKSLSS